MIPGKGKGLMMGWGTKKTRQVEVEDRRNPRNRGVSASARREKSRARDSHLEVHLDRDDDTRFDESEIDQSDRRTRQRGISASARREKTGARNDDPRGLDTAIFSPDTSARWERTRDRGKHPQEQQDFDMDDDDDAPADAFDDSESDHPVPIPALHQVVRGKSGRFVSTGDSTSSGASKPSKKIADNGWKVTDAVPGGPIDGSVIPSFLGHVASRMWVGQLRGLLKCHTRLGAGVTLKDWYSKMPTRAKDLVRGTGLSHLQKIMHFHIDWALICAFVERWQPDTNTFHMPFGEMTIMLHDVWHILRIEVDGIPVSEEADTDILQSHCMELLGMDKSSLMKEAWKGGRLSMASIRTACSNRVAETQANGWTLILIGCTLFIDKSGNRLLPSPLLEINGSDDIQGYSWGSATLAYLYRQLGEASRGGSGGIAGCLILLQSWIYEYFPCFRPQRIHIAPNDPRACMWSAPAGRTTDEQSKLLHLYRQRIDHLTAYDVHWQPYGPDQHELVQRTKFHGFIQCRSIIEPYMPARVLRQLGFVQSIPPPIYRPEREFRSWSSERVYKVDYPATIMDGTWDAFPCANGLIVENLCRVSDDPTDAFDGYIDWYNEHSHPLVLPSTDPEDFKPSYVNAIYWVPQTSLIIRDMIIDMARFDPALAKTYEEQLEQHIERWSLSDC